MADNFNSKVLSNLYKVDKMQNQKIDIDSYLPKFYSKQQEISLILNPLLKNIRQSKVSSYHQLQDLNFTSQHLQNHSPVIPKHRNFVFHRKNIKNDPLPQRDCSLDQKDGLHEKISMCDFGSKEINLIPGKNMIENFQSTEKKNLMFKNRNLSYNIRSKTSNQKKKHKTATLTPGTADVHRIIDHSEFQKGKFLFSNPENETEDFDDEFYNYIQLKLLNKSPYFTGGKFSKIKKHLIEEINLEQIQKKFFQTPSAVTKYKDFFQRILLRRKQNQVQKMSQNKSIFNTISEIRKQASTIVQKGIETKKQSKYDFSKPSYSQTLQGQDLPYQISKALSPQRKRKTSLKAKLFYRKSPLDENFSNQQSIVSKVNPHLNLIEITGRKQNFSIAKKPLCVSIV